MDTYNPKDISLTVAGILISGFGDEKVKVRRDADIWGDESGADGDVVRFGTNDKRGEFEFTLQQTSASNLHLSALAKTDELTGAGTIPTIVNDARGNDLHVAPTSWIKQIPEAVYNKGVSVRTWVIRTNNLQNFLGGA